MIINRLILKITIIVLLLISCNGKEFHKDVLIGIWSIDSVYYNNKFNNGLFFSNGLIFEKDKIIFPNSINNSFLKSVTFCNKKNWFFLHSDTLGYYITFSRDCRIEDTAFVCFINDKKIRQLRFEFKLENAVYYGRKGLTFYSQQKDLFDKLEKSSKEIKLDEIYSKTNQKQEDIVNKFTHQ